MNTHATRRGRCRALFQDFSRGFSLAELLVTVSVAGTLASLAVPSFARMVQDSRRTAVVNELLATVLQARAVAGGEGRSVVVCGAQDADGNGALDPAERRCGGADWSRGWLAAAWTDANRDGRVDADELGEPLRTYVNDQPGLTVRAEGFANAPAAAIAVLRPLDRFSSNGTILVCDRRGAEAARALVLAGSGRARVVQRATDGRPLACP